MPGSRAALRRSQEVTSSNQTPAGVIDSSVAQTAGDLDTLGATSSGALDTLGAASGGLPVEALTEVASGSVWRVLLIVGLGLPFLYWLTLWGRAVVGRRVGAHQGVVAGKLIFYPGACLLAVMVMRELGFSLAPVLGAAGVLGIAVGFASQTSVGNIVSGFFLVGEKPFVVGDIIKIGTTAGRVLSVGMLSVQLRTWDNRFIRVPNETLMKGELTNLTRFPIRRVDIEVRASYEDDLGLVHEVLLEAARSHPRALMEPEPRIYFIRFGETAVHLKLTVWATQHDRRLLKHTLPPLVKASMDRHGLRMPYLTTLRAIPLEGEPLTT